MITAASLFEMKQSGEKIAMLTCYDASFATLLENAGVDVLLVGDSLGMTIKGEDSTLSVSLEDMCYHTRAVAKGASKALILADLPFGCYQQNPQQAFASASKLMAAGAHMVKLEGGAWMAETTMFLQMRGIPVCAHIGLTPQSVFALGGYRIQGKTEAAAGALIKDALSHEEAGASMVLMECIPAELAAKVTDKLKCPTIGIGAGIDCDGQVLVLQDMLGIYAGKKAKFVQNFMEGQNSIQAAVQSYVSAVKEKRYPQPIHSF